LQPKDLSSTAKVSEDVVIVGEKPSAVEEKWKIFTNIRVILGDRVSLYGFGFEGRVAGNLLLTDRPGEVTTASGELSIPEGRYQAYGQRLEVELGKVLFTGGPVSNPGLDLRAVRKVENVTAGVRIRGTLRNPQLELFSIPAMGETDILSYLVLGRPIDAQSGEDAKVVAQAALLLSLKGGDLLARSLTDRFGLDEMRIETSNTGEQASLVVGRYLSPKLYVSYGVGLIDSVNTFNVRYRLSEHWQLRAESGLHQSADAIYTIER
jgi:translocation and assembly module TamB